MELKSACCFRCDSLAYPGEPIVSILVYFAFHVSAGRQIQPSTLLQQLGNYLCFPLSVCSHTVYITSEIKSYYPFPSLAFAPQRIYKAAQPSLTFAEQKSL